MYSHNNVYLNIIWFLQHFYYLPIEKMAPLLFFWIFKNDNSAIKLLNSFIFNCTFGFNVLLEDISFRDC